jgi:PKD repeat protein
MVSYLRFNWTPGVSNYTDEGGIQWSALGAGSPAPSIDTSTYKFYNGSLKLASTTTGLSAANGSQWVWGTNHTIEFWLYPTSTGSNQFLFWQGSAGYSPVELRYQGGTGYKNVTVYASSANVSYDLVNGAFSPANSVPLNTWSHIEIDYASPTLTVYVNGRSNITATLASDPYVNPGNFTISRPAGSGVAGAYLDEWVVWDTTRHLSNFVPETLGYGIPVLEADFTGTPQSGTAALLVQFSDNSTNVSPGATYYWTFGDGDTSTEENPLHVYDAFGTYEVNHSVTLLDGQTDFELKSDFVITSTEQNSPSVTSYPKYVTFHLKEGLGTPIPDVVANLTPISTSTGAWDWLAVLTGIPLDEVALTTENLTQTTDSLGRATFYVIPTGKYNVTFTKTGYTFTPMILVPQDDDYIIYAVETTSGFFKDGYDELETVNITVQTVYINSTAHFVNMSYNDTLAHTTGGFINVTAKNVTVGGADVTLTSWAVTASQCTNSTVIIHETPVSGLVESNVTHTDFGYIGRSYPYTFKGAPVSFMGLGGEIVLLVVIGLMTLTTMGGGILVGRHAAFVACAEGWFFYAIGWFDSLIARGSTTETLLILALSIATVASIAAIFELRKKAEKY